MRLPCCVVVLLMMTPVVSAQIKEERRYGVRHNGELYPQATAQETLGSLLRALDKERYDYIAAFLLDPTFVAEQLKITAPYFDQLAAKQVAAEGLEKKFDPQYISQRRRELAEQANFEDLGRRIRTKLAGDPETEKELRKFLREGEFNEAGERTTATHPDIRGRSLFFRSINGRWYIENKMSE